VGRLGNLTIETFHRRKDGTIFPVEVTINKLDFHGEAYLFIFANDITERRKNERELHLTKFFMDKAPIMIFRGHKDGRVLYANEHAAKVLGYTMEELSSMTFFDIVPGLGEQRWKKHRLELRDKGLRKFEAVHRCRDGARIPVEVTVGYLKFEDEEFSCAFSHDFSDRKKAEESLRESEKKFRMLTETSPNGIVVVDRARIVYANKAATRISGFSSDELLGRGLWDFVKQDYRRIRKNKTTTEVPPSRSESRLVTRDGRERWVMATRASMEYEGKPATLVTLIDITEAKHAEEALRESEARLKVAMELAGLVPWELDVLSGVFHFNEQFYKLYGTSSDIEGSFLMPAARYMNGFVHPEDIQEVEKAIESTLQGRDTETGHHMEHRIIRADGEERWISVRWDNIYDKDGRLAKTVGANQDTTVQHQAEEERKSLETQLHQAQKMEAIGQLAGGVAHDFNNILTAMIGFAELISMKLDRESPLHHYLGQIISAGGRAADLTQGLLAFSRKQVLNVKVLEVHDVIEGFRKMLRRLIPEDIELKINVSPTGMPVMADRGQLEQVLMNLATNARDAMPSGGVLKIEAAPVDLDRETVHGWGFGEPGKYAMVSISDNGCGMDHETMSKIFEPFFTTKPVGKGTGLGLAIIYGIIKQHEGFVTVDSSHGIGSIFNIYLPLTDRKQEEQAITPAMEPKTGGSGTILLAEDDETVRELHTLTLSEAGYRVIAGSDGRDALRRFIAAGARADILVTDVIMPNMDGKSLYEAMCSLHPGMKVLFLSGYSAEILNQRGISEINLMPKPVLPSELMQRVREILTEGVNVPRQSPARQD
jgi:PAS domain S-box-containing protein